MQAHLLEKALSLVKSEQLLVNIISRRVRQLSNGQRPMIAAEFRMGLADIALTEVIEGHINFELTRGFVEEPIAPHRSNERQTDGWQGDKPK